MPFDTGGRNSGSCRFAHSGRRCQSHGRVRPPALGRRCCAKIDRRLRRATASHHARHAEMAVRAPAGETFARCASHGTDDRQQARTGHVLVGGLNWSSRVSHSDRVRRSFRACTIETVKSKYEDHLLSELGPRPGTVSGTYKRHVAARPVLFISQVTVTFVEHAIPILPRRRSAGCEMR